MATGLELLQAACRIGYCRNVGSSLLPRAVRPCTVAGAGRDSTRMVEGDRYCLARSARSPQARPDFDQRADHGGSEAGGRGGRQRAARVGTGIGNRADQGRKNAWRARRELAAVAPPGRSRS